MFLIWSDEHHCSLYSRIVWLFLEQRFYDCSYNFSFKIINCNHPITVSDMSYSNRLPCILLPTKNKEKVFPWMNPNYAEVTTVELDTTLFYKATGDCRL